jgi:hypothetical protein
MISLDEIFREVYAGCVTLHINKKRETLIELSTKPKEEIIDWIIDNSSAKIKKGSIVQYDILTERVETPFVNVIYRP